MRNGGTLAGLADDDVVEVPARIGRGRRGAAWRSRRWRPSCSAWSSTSRRTSGSRRRPRRAAIAPRRGWRSWSNPLVREYRLADSLTERMLADEARARRSSDRGGAVDRRPRAWRSTEGASRPTSRCSTRAARCCRSSGAAGARPTTSGSKAASRCSRSLLERAVARGGPRTARPPVRVDGPVPARGRRPPGGARRAPRRDRADALERAAGRRQRHARAAPRRHRPRVGNGGGVRHRDQLPRAGGPGRAGIKAT